VGAVEPAGETRITRRTALRAGAGAALALGLGPGLLGNGFEAIARRARPGRGPYGPVGPPDENGIRLPRGFRSRMFARAGQPVPGTAYPWHAFPDAMGTIRTGDGGFILVSNSEIPGGLGGASSIRLGPDGEIRDAYRILSGTSNNCAGGVTPWDTWLSCEEVEDGRVWECDPGGGAPVERPAMGTFNHEAACVDPKRRRLYLTEDEGSAGFYRFTPDRYPDLSSGRLEVAGVHGNGLVRWLRVPDPSASAQRTLAQVPGATHFRRGEGIWFDRGTVYMATTSDDRVWAYDTKTREIEILYDGKALGDRAPLHEVDNVTVSEQSGDMFVCEDADDLDICVVTPEGQVARFLQLTGTQQTETELTGPVFDPSGRRFFVSSQRAFGLGVIYEITGPFRRRRPDLERIGLRVSVLGKPTAASMPKAGIPIRVQLREGLAKPASVRARLVAGKGRALAEAERRVRPDARRFRMQLRPSRGASKASPGDVVRLSVVARFGSGRRNRFSAPVRLD
jgi:uncharacterized protein